jgi:uncharacterized membrane protein
MRPIIALALLAALAACSPQDPDGNAAPPPADAPPPAPEAKATTPTGPALAADFMGDIDALGTEPFWSLTIRKDVLMLTRPDQSDVLAPAGTPVMQGDKAVWTTPSLVVSLAKADCSDGMSDRKFPLTAQVTLGSTVLKGCAAKAGAAPAAE